PRTAPDEGCWPPRRDPCPARTDRSAPRDATFDRERGRAQRGCPPPAACARRWSGWPCPRPRLRIAPEGGCAREELRARPPWLRNPNISPGSSCTSPGKALVRFGGGRLRSVEWSEKGATHGRVPADRIA